jgi:hypothetical protein
MDHLTPDPSPQERGAIGSGQVPDFRFLVNSFTCLLVNCCLNLFYLEKPVIFCRAE